MEIRWALIQKSADAFHIFVPRSGLALQVALEVELSVKTVAGGSGEGALYEAERMRRAGREALGDRMRFSHQVLIVDDAVDHARGVRLLGSYGLGEHHQRAGARVADEPGQNKGASRVRNKADPGERLQELC